MDYMVGHVRVSMTRSNDNCDVLRQPFTNYEHLFHAYMNNKQLSKCHVKQAWSSDQDRTDWCSHETVSAVQEITK